MPSDHTLTATFNNPKYNITGGGSGKTGVVPETFFSTSVEFNTISAIMLFIKDEDVSSVYAVETDDTNNPLQLNSTMTAVDSGISSHAPVRSLSGSETTTRASGENRSRSG